MSNATIIAEAFGEDADLYEILGVDKKATQAELRKAYYRKVNDTSVRVVVVDLRYYYVNCVNSLSISLPQGLGMSS
jgi:preprotein translocase subunit Sec63